MIDVLLLSVDDGDFAILELYIQLLDILLSNGPSICWPSSQADAGYARSLCLAMSIPANSISNGTRKTPKSFKPAKMGKHHNIAQAIITTAPSMFHPRICK